MEKIFRKKCVKKAKVKQKNIIFIQRDNWKIIPSNCIKNDTIFKFCLLNKYFWSVYLHTKLINNNAITIISLKLLLFLFSDLFVDNIN